MDSLKQNDSVCESHNLSGGETKVADNVLESRTQSLHTGDQDDGSTGHMSKNQKKRLAKMQRIAEAKASKLQKSEKSRKVLPEYHSLGDSSRAIQITIEYDGTNFIGWQSQGQRRTVQECIEGGILKLTGEKLRIKAASRTDKHVHAEGQIAVFETKSKLSDAEMLSSLNSRLPEDIVVHALRTVRAPFEPRAKAKKKVYEYRIVHGTVRPVLTRKYVWYMKKSLDIALMIRAAKYLEGNELDFTSFSAVDSGVQSSYRDPRCTIDSISFVDTSESSLRIQFHGDRFLYRMIRIIVGTLVDVGLHKTPPDAMPDILEKRNRKFAGQGAPPHGLTLKSIEFLPDVND